MYADCRLGKVAGQSMLEDLAIARKVVPLHQTCNKYLYLEKKSARRPLHMLANGLTSW